MPFSTAQQPVSATQARGRMTERSLQVTYRNGRAFSAYLHLSIPTGEKSAKSMPAPDGLLVVDYGATGRAVGIEVTAPQAVSLERLNKLRADLGEVPLTEQDTTSLFEPRRAAPLLVERGAGPPFTRLLSRTRRNAVCKRCQGARAQPRRRPSNSAWPTGS